MAIPGIPFNPMATTNARGSFSIYSDGFVQGVAMDDPAARYSLAGGVIALTETLPMIGGALIYETTVGGVGVAGADTLGGVVGRATSLAMAAGFSVLNQAHHWLSSPQSEAPMGLSGMTVNFHRFGSGARIALALDPQMAAALQGGLTNQQVSWDFNLQRVIPYASVTAQETITGITWAAGVATVTTSVPHGYVVGNDVTISGAIPIGYNGTYTISTVPTTTTYTYALATNPGTNTTPGVVAAGGGLLPIRLLDINIGNSKTLTYDPVLNAGHWNNAGSAVLALI